MVGVGARISKRSTLAEEVPAAVELDLDGAQPVAVFVELLRLLTVCFFAAPKLVLLGDEALDSRRDALITHRRILRPMASVTT